MNLDLFFESVYNEARSIKLFYIGRLSDNNKYTFPRNLKYTNIKDAENAKLEFEKKFPISTFKVFNEDDPEVLSYLNVKRIEPEVT